MKIHKVCQIVLFLFLLTFSFACKKDNIKPKTPNKFERQWFSISGHLKIDSLNNFEFVRFTCVSQTISKGKWQIKNDTLILNSFKPKGCYYIEDFKIEPPKDTTNIVANQKTEKDCQPNTGYLIFKNEKFYINDTILMSKSAAYDQHGELNYHTNFWKTNFYGK